MVLKINDLIIGEGKPKVCVPVVAENKQDILNFIDDYKDLNIDLIELRIDFYKDILNDEEVKRLFNDVKLLNISKPLILTYRSKNEGGNIQLENNQYFNLYKLAIESGAFDIYDVELSVGTNMAIEFKTMIHDANKYMLMSNHNFNRTPTNDIIFEKFDLMESFEADIYKVAYMPESDEDVLSLLQTCKEASHKYHKPIVTMSMGPIGLISRVVGEQFGNAITFGAVDNTSAPGQINYQELNTILDIVHKNI